MNNQVEMIAVSSTNVAAIGYDDASMQLYVRFLKNNSLYVYENVPIGEFNGLLNSASKGSYFYENIRKGGYHCTRIE